MQLYCNCWTEMSLFLFIYFSTNLRLWVVWRETLRVGTKVILNFCGLFTKLWKEQLKSWNTRVSFNFDRNGEREKKRKDIAMDRWGRKSREVWGALYQNPVSSIHLDVISESAMPECIISMRIMANAFLIKLLNRVFSQERSNLRFLNAKC